MGQWRACDCRCCMQLRESVEAMDVLRMDHEEANGQLRERCGEQIQQIDVLLSEVSAIRHSLDC